MSKKLIDADSFKKSVLTDFWENYTQCHDTDQTSLMDMVMDNLDEQPTIDAVPVVRCRDCVHGININSIIACTEFCMVSHKPEDFCNYGERKGGAD